MTATTREEVEQIIHELEEKAERHREKSTSLLGLTVPNMAKAEAYEEIAKMLQERIAGEGL